MGRYTGRTDRECSQDRIAQAQKKHEHKLKERQELFPKDEIYALEFDPGTYGKRIYCLRTSKGLTAIDLANEIGTTTATLSKMENGITKSFNIDFLYLICAVFDTSPHYLFGLSSDPHAIPQKDENGKTEYLSLPIKATEKTPALLTNELTELYGIPEIVNDSYLKDPDLCEALLFILKHRDPNIRLRLKAAIHGICAICLPPDEFERLKGVDEWPL